MGEFEFGKSLKAALPNKVAYPLNMKDGDALVSYLPDFEAKMARADDIISRYRNTLQVLAQ